VKSKSLYGVNSRTTYQIFLIETKEYIVEQVYNINKFSPIKLKVAGVRDDRAKKYNNFAIFPPKNILKYIKYYYKVAIGFKSKIVNYL